MRNIFIANCISIMIEKIEFLLLKFKENPSDFKDQLEIHLKKLQDSITLEEKVVRITLKEIMQHINDQFNNHPLTKHVIEILLSPF